MRRAFVPINRGVGEIGRRLRNPRATFTRRRFATVVAASEAIQSIRSFPRKRKSSNWSHVRGTSGRRGTWITSYALSGLLAMTLLKAPCTRARPGRCRRRLSPACRSFSWPRRRFRPDRDHGGVAQRGALGAADVGEDFAAQARAAAIGDGDDVKDCSAARDIIAGLLQAGLQVGGQAGRGGLRRRRRRAWQRILRQRGRCRRRYLLGFAGVLCRSRGG